MNQSNSVLTQIDRVLARAERDHGRIDFRRRDKVSRPDHELPLQLELRLQQDAQDPVGPATGIRDHPQGDFVLDHHHGTGDGRFAQRGKQVEQDGTRDLVGQIAHEDEAAGRKSVV